MKVCSYPISSMRFPDGRSSSAVNITLAPCTHAPQVWLYGSCPLFAASLTPDSAHQKSFHSSIAALILKLHAHPTPMMAGYERLNTEVGICTASKKIGVHELPCPMHRRFPPDAAAVLTADTTSSTVLGTRMFPGVVGSKLCSVFCTAHEAGEMQGSCTL